MGRCWVAAAVLALAGCAQYASEAPAGSPQRFAAELSGAQRVPPLAGPGAGQAELEFDPRTSLLQWRVRAIGLSGVPTAAHLHGPAPPGQNGPVVVPLDIGAERMAGRVRLTPEQFTQLDSGHWYLDLHTAAHPDGEIRGQLRHRLD